MNCPGCQVSLCHQDNAISVQTITYGYFCVLEGRPVEYRRNTDSISIICMACGYNLKDALADMGIVLDASGRPHKI